MFLKISDKRNDPEKIIQKHDFKLDKKFYIGQKSQTFPKRF